MSLSTLASPSSQRITSFLYQKVYDDPIITSDGLYPYRPLAEGFNVCQISLRGGLKVIDIFPDVHRLIARPKTWIRGIYPYVSRNHLNRYLAEFSYGSTGESRSNGWLSGVLRADVEGEGLSPLYGEARKARIPPVRLQKT